MYYARDISHAFMKPIEEALLEEEKKRERRAYIGGSWIGYPCERRVAYTYTKQRGAVQDPRILRIFNHGHTIEDMVLSWLSKAYDVVAFDDEGKQFGFSHLDGNYKGHLDFVLMGDKGRNTGIKFPCHGDVKGLATGPWKEVKSKGLRTARPEYYTQLQVYGQSVKPIIDGKEVDLSQNPSIFFAYKKEGAREPSWDWINQDPEDIYVELVQPNRDHAVEMFRRAKRILEKPDPMAHPRLSDDRTHMMCRMCPYHQICHGAEKYEKI